MGCPPTLLGETQHIIIHYYRIHYYTLLELMSFIYYKSVGICSYITSCMENSTTGPCMCSKTSFKKNCFSAWASTLNMGLINKVDMVCLSPVGYGV